MFRRLCFRVAPLAVAASLAMPRAAAAAPEDELSPAALEHVDRANAYYDEENYEAAALEFKEAYAIDGNPGLLFNWAQVVRLSGDCAKSDALYDQYLSINPDAEEAKVARTNKLDCVGDGPEESPPDDEPIKPVYKDWVGAVLLGTGIAAAIGGGVLLAVGKREVEESPDQPFEDSYADEIDAGRAKYTAGAVVMGIGGALIVGGIVRYSVLAARNKKKSESRTTRVVPGPGFGLALQGRF